MQKFLTTSSQFDFTQSIICSNQTFWNENNNFDLRQILFEKLFFIKTDFNIKAKLLKFTNSHIIYSENKLINYIDAQIQFIYGNKNSQIGIKFSKGDHNIDIIGDFGQFISHIKQNTIQTDFHEKFRLQTLIGRGNRSEVYRALDKSNQNDVCVKIFDKTKFRKEKETKALINEIKYLRSLKYDKIISLTELFEDKKFIYIITPLLKGGDLSQLVQQGNLQEDKCQIILQQIFDGLNFLHSQKLFHRDLKPQNIMLKSLNDLSSICIIDLGLVEQYEDNAVLNCDRCGTQGFIAPEILKGYRYDTRVDVFSAGLILYFLLTGRKPFQGISNSEVYQNNLIGVLNLNNLNCSQICLEFLKKCLTIEQNQRITSVQALQHPFLQKTNEKEIQQNGFSQLRSLRISCSKLRRIKTIEIQEPQEEEQFQIAQKTARRQFLIRKQKFF